jgi:hypothetical protein
LPLVLLSLLLMLLPLPLLLALLSPPFHVASLVCSTHDDDHKCAKKGIWEKVFYWNLILQN